MERLEKTSIINFVKKNLGKEYGHKHTDSWRGIIVGVKVKHDDKLLIAINCISSTHKSKSFEKEYLKSINIDNKTDLYYTDIENLIRPNPVFPEIIK